MDGLWRNSMTWKNRYDDFGVTGYILLYAKGRKDAVVIDVGCSRGIAAAESKKCLARHGTRLRTIGIDMSGNAELIAKAESNMDEFINKDAREIDGRDEQADIVVCLNVVRFVPGDVKSSMIVKCAEFLKPGGVMITGVGGRHRKMLELEEPSARQPPRVCAGRTLRSLIVSRQDTRMMRRDGALRYAGIIRTEWNSMGRFRKGMARVKYGILASVWR